MVGEAFAIFGAGLPPNLVLMAKVIVLAFWLQSHLPLSSRLPFFPFFDHLDLRKYSTARYCLCSSLELRRCF